MFRKFSVDLCCVRGKHLLMKHTHTESFKITPRGLTHGPPNLIHTNPQHLNAVLVSRDHGMQYRHCCFLGDQSLLCTASCHLSRNPASAPIHNGIVLSNGASPTRTGKRAQPSTTRFFLSRGMVPEYLPCSQTALHACD